MTAPAGGAVSVAYLHGNDLAYSFHLSLMSLVAYDLEHDGRVVAGGWLGMKAGTGGIVEGRNKLVREFLARTDSEWLWWVDSDMGFAPDTVDRLLASADPVDRPVIGGLCFAYKELAADGMGGYRCAPGPTIFDWVKSEDREGFQGRTTYPVADLVACDGTGAACILIHRSALEKVREKFGTWYDRIPSGADLISEDLSFCMRLAAVGLPLFVDTSVRTTHAKTTWVAEADYWSQAVAPPATADVAVIVPVLGRPNNAAPFMASLLASTGLATAYAVLGGEVDKTSYDDTAEAWAAAGAVVLDSDLTSFAEKANDGYRSTREPWLFLTGDDVRFGPGWLDHAQAIAGDRHHVVGTRDLGNPRVEVGEHATHLLVRRSYVDEVGASWDGPGVVAHEGYRHWYVDDEIVTAAKLRGVWAMALGSVVEHLHPLFGKAVEDDTYRLGQASADADRVVFGRRLQANAQRPAAAKELGRDAVDRDAAPVGGRPNEYGETGA